MASSLNAFLACLLALLATPALAVDGSVRLRYLSFVLRDAPPSVDDAKAFAQGTKTLDQLVDAWLATPEHQARVERYFNDMFGVRDGIMLMEDAFVLEKNEWGVYNLPDKPACNGGQAVSVAAWWTDGTVRLCPGAVSSALVVSGHKCGEPWTDGLKAAGCGCGPQQLLCIPKELTDPLKAEVVGEFARRGVKAYADGVTWTQLFAGPYSYGNRLLYWYYLFQEGLHIHSRMPSAGELATLASIPVDAPAVWDAPNGQERAGVATMPGFLKQRNNFRSRFRGLTQALLCKDVDATLNTDGIAVFVNPDLDANDLQHGHKPGCQECHYPMDNAGSTLINWDTNGDLRYGAAVQLTGHVFGEDGAGPGFLVKSFVERHPLFSGCMAKRAWEDISGKSYDLLTADDHAAFEAAAQKGPRDLLQAIFRSAQLKAVPGGDQ